MGLVGLCLEMKQGQELVVPPQPQGMMCGDLQVAIGDTHGTTVLGTRSHPAKRSRGRETEAGLGPLCSHSGGENGEMGTAGVSGNSLGAHRRLPVLSSLSPQVKVWFQNRRTKYKRQKLEEEGPDSDQKKKGSHHINRWRLATKQSSGEDIDVTSND